MFSISRIKHILSIYIREKRQIDKYLKIIDKSKIDCLNNLRLTSNSQTLRICGNGDSLNEMDISDGVEYLAMNYCANSQKFLQLRPKYYTVIDPLAFATDDDINGMLKPIVEKVDWEMYFFTRTSVRCQKLDDLFASNKHIHLIYWNAWSVADFYEKNKKYCYEHNLGIPCDENVMIAAIYIGIMLKFKNIELYGVNHDWMKYLFVDEDNNVRIYDRHFYDTSEPKSIVHQMIPGVPSRMYEIMQEYANVFKAYLELRQLADTKGIRILNCTKDSYIDAFERKKF